MRVQFSRFCKPTLGPAFLGLLLGVSQPACHMLPKPESKSEAERAVQPGMFTTEVQAEVMDTCLQLHGGYGYMLEYPIARMYADARVSRIYGGSSEIMKVIIAKDLGL